MTEAAPYFIRYSDDMIVLGDNRDKLLLLLKEIETKFQLLGLSINEKKTNCVSLEEGTDFLGYHFYDIGKAVPQKAEQNLQDRLEMMWLTSSELPIEEKIIKAIEIIGGWEQYFGNERKPGSIFEYAVLVYCAREKEECQSYLEKCRTSVQNIYRDITLYLAQYWKESGKGELELLEYEQYYRIWDPQQRVITEELLTELLFCYRQIVISEKAELAVEIMQLYTDIGQYEKAAFWMEKKAEFKKLPADVVSVALGTSVNESEMQADRETAGKILKVFAGREDIYSEEVMAEEGRRQSQIRPAPMTEKKVLEHLSGSVTLGTYIQRPNGTVKYLVVDVDISKKVLLELKGDREIFSAYLEKARGKAEKY